MINQMIAKLGENISVRRFVRLKVAKRCGSYAAAPAARRPLLRPAVPQKACSLEARRVVDRESLLECPPSPSRNCRRSPRDDHLHVREFRRNRQGERPSSIAWC